MVRQSDWQLQFRNPNNLQTGEPIAMCFITQHGFNNSASQEGKQKHMWKYELPALWPSKCFAWWQNSTRMPLSHCLFYHKLCTSLGWCGTCADALCVAILLMCWTEFWCSRSKDLQFSVSWPNSIAVILWRLGNAGGEGWAVSQQLLSATLKYIVMRCTNAVCCITFECCVLAEYSDISVHWGGWWAVC